MTRAGNTFTDRSAEMIAEEIRYLRSGHRNLAQQLASVRRYVQRPGATGREPRIGAAIGDVSNNALGTFEVIDMNSGAQLGEQEQAWNRTGQTLKQDILHMLLPVDDTTFAAFPYELTDCPSGQVVNP